MRKLLFPLVMAMMAALVLAACNEGDANEGTGSEALTEYKIGVIYSKTGPYEQSNLKAA